MVKCLPSDTKERVQAYIPSKHILSLIRSYKNLLLRILPLQHSLLPLLFYVLLGFVSPLDNFVFARIICDKTRHNDR